MAVETMNEQVRYEPDDAPPHLVTLGAGFQAAMLVVAPVVFTVVIVARAADQPEAYVSWSVFAALLVSGIATVLQAVRVGRIGAGRVLIMGTSGAFIAVCVAALANAGPATMASLIVVSSLIQFLMAWRLALLRRICTPVITGTVIMLIAATVTPIVFDTLTSGPDNASPIAAPLAGLTTIVAVVVLILRAAPRWRLWSPVIGIAAGCAVSLPFGLYDLQPVLDAPWVGAPFSAWPGLDVTPGVEFWALLPAFIVVTLVGAIETVGDGVAIQRVSQRQLRATDFRVVQGSLNADGVGNLLSGIAGTLPNTTYSTSISLAEVTGIAARRVGAVIGLSLLTVAFFPKFTALLIAIPGPVAAAYVIVLLGMLFVQGMKIIIQDGVDHRKAAIAGTAFWLGVGFQNQWIFPELLGDGFLSVLLGNGMTSGAIVAVAMVSFIELTGPRRKRLNVNFDADTLAKLQEFLKEFATRAGWSAAATERLLLVGEEALGSLTEEAGPENGNGRRLAVTVRAARNNAELEFVSALATDNLEDRLAYLGEMPDIPEDREISFRILRHYASSVRHQKYHDVDIVTVNIARQD